MIKKLTELAKEENVVLDYCIGPDNAMTITVLAKHRDFISINALSFIYVELLEITKGVIRRAKND